MIVWLASYPRSGNTFLRTLLHTYFGERSISRYKIGQPKPEHLRPYGLWTARTLVDMTASDELFFVKTHEWHEGGTQPALYLVRDGRDALVSYTWFALWQQGKARKDVNAALYRNTLKSLMVDERSSFGTWSQNVLAWRDRPRTVYVKFEDLIRQPELVVGCIRQLGLGCQLHAETRAPTFLELQQQMPDMYRRGKVGSWRDEFPRDLLALFWELHGAGMREWHYDQENEPVQRRVG